MKIALLYLRIRKRADPTLAEPFSYVEGERRFHETYLKFKPSIPHDLIVVNCGQADEDHAFDDIASGYECYDGLGSDCGTYQVVGGRQTADLVICCNTIAYFWRAGWLEPFVRAWEEYGAGVYGPTSSFEHHPHLRTPCIASTPELFASYPIRVNSRSDAVEFESGCYNFSLSAHYAGVPSRLVTFDGSYALPDWRQPPNIFRRGDQSNCPVWDRHTDLFKNATASDQKTMSENADHHV